MIELVQKEMKQLRLRKRLLPSGYFSEIWWLLILELACSSYRGERANAADLCRNTGTSASIAMRWLQALVADGLVSEHRCESNPHVTFVSLSPLGHQMVKAILNPAT